MSQDIKGPFDEDPILDLLAEHVIDVYQMIALRHRGLTAAQFRTLALLLNRLRARWGQDQTRDDPTHEDEVLWTPRRVNDVRNLDRNGWIRADEPWADWYKRHVEQKGP